MPLLDLSAQADGAIVEFDLGATYLAGSVRVWVNGLLRASGEYAEAGGSIVTLTAAPLVGDTVHARYRAPT